MDKKVSVVIPYYNGSQYIGQCLDSVLAQTYKNYEIILVDDCSTEDISILDKYQDKIRYFRTDKNHGRPAPTKNIAIQKATGELTAFLDQDDWWEPTKLEKQVKLFEDNDVGLVFSNNFVFDDDKNILLGKNYDLLELNADRETISHALFKGNFITACTAIVRKDLIEKIGMLDENYNNADDYDLWYRISKVAKIAAIEEPLATWRYRSQSLSNQKLLGPFHDLKYFYEKHSQDDLLSENEKRQALAEVYRVESILLATQKKYIEAIKKIVLSIKLRRAINETSLVILLCPMLVKHIPQLVRFQLKTTSLKLTATK